MNNLSPKSKNKLGIASSIPPKMSERFGSAVSPYLQSVQELFPPTNPYGQATSNFLLGQAPQAAQRMAEGYPNVLFDTRNPLGGNRIVNPVALDMAAALPVATALKGAGLLAKGAPLVGGITTWHGSPHKFEPTSLNDLGEFNAAKIGTGEGAQAYGHGHYTAENPNIAKSYQEELSRPQATLDFVDRQGKPANMEHFNDHPELAAEIDSAMQAFDADGTVSPDFDEILNNVRFNLNSEINNRFTDPDDLPALKNSLAKLGAIEGKYDFVRNENAGSFYKVDIPDEHIAQMLDWDKPLSEQSESVRAAVKKLPVFKGSEKFLDSGQATGRAIHSYLEDGLKHTPEQVTQLMQQAGIPGIRYLDAGSRGAEGGTSNFVVFPGNEHMMTILERNGQAMSPESQAIARYREIKGPKSVVRMEAALRTAGVPLPKSEPVAYIQGLVDRAHRRN